MICDLCGKKGAQTKNTTRSFGSKKDLLVIENVPVIVCPHCGGSYLLAETLYEVERIKMHRATFSKKRAVSVAEYV